MFLSLDLRIIKKLNFKKFKFDLISRVFDIVNKIIDLDFFNDC